MNKSLPVALIAAPLVAALCVACSLPRVYKLTVQQGNVITQSMVDRLKPGMTREQVAYVMGDPVIRNPFDEGRWDYVYALRVPGYVNETVTMSLFFTDDVLTHFTGDFKPSETPDDADEEESAASAADASAVPTEPAADAQPSDPPADS